jgi:hypothetical protein
MWRGYAGALAHYTIVCCEEWECRGYTDSVAWEIGLLMAKYVMCYDNPSWIGGKIHRSHQAALLWKDPVWYGQFGWTVQPKVEYVWGE